jgi:hypothetical protein
MQLNITEVLADPNIESKIQLVNYLIERVSEKQSNQIFETEVNNFIKKIEKKSKNDSLPQVIGPNEALGCLVADFLIDLIKIDNFSEQAELLKDLLDQINAYLDSPKELIKKPTIHRLIKILIQWRIDPAFTDRFCRKLKIYMVPYEYKKFNAYYHVGYYSIVLFKSKLGFEEFIFFHEVGHMVAHWITGDHTKVPESFIEFSKKLRPGIKVDYIENFADLFAVAVMIGTSVAHKNPAYNGLSGPELLQIKQYFTKLINSEVTKGHLLSAQVLSRFRGYI